VTIARKVEHKRACLRVIPSPVNDDDGVHLIRSFLSTRQLIFAG
jgi:hypothetical protein